MLSTPALSLVLLFSLTLEVDATSAAQDWPTVDCVEVLINSDFERLPRRGVLFATDLPLDVGDDLYVRLNADDALVYRHDSFDVSLPGPDGVTPHLGFSATGTPQQWNNNTSTWIASGDTSAVPQPVDVAKRHGITRQLAYLLLATMSLLGFNAAALLFRIAMPGKGG